jgi:hypothetical protein
MTADESRVLIRLLQFSLNQGDLVLQATQTIFQWMDNHDAMQSLRDEMLKRLVTGDKSQDVLNILENVSEESRRAHLNR